MISSTTSQASSTRLRMASSAVIWFSTKPRRSSCVMGSTLGAGIPSASSLYSGTIAFLPASTESACSWPALSVYVICAVPSRTPSCESRTMLPFSGASPSRSTDRRSAAASSVTGSLETYMIVPRMPTTIVDVLTSIVSFASSFSLTSRKILPSVRFIESAPAFFSNSTRLSASRVTMRPLSRPTEAELASPVFMASPLLRRAFSMTGRCLPAESSISTVPS